MQHRLVPDTDVLPDAEREAWVGVQHGTVLDVAALAHFDPFTVVTAQYCIRPYARVLAHVHLADDRRAIGHIGASVHLWRVLAQRVDRHESVLLLGATSRTSMTSS